MDGSVSLIYKSNQFQNFIASIPDFELWTAKEKLCGELEIFTCSHILNETGLLRQIANPLTDGNALSHNVVPEDSAVPRGWTAQA
jgi:hypothetical protein